MAKVFNRAIQIYGELVKIGGVSVRVLELDGNGDILKASGVTVPSGAGFAKGAQFIKTDAATGVKSVYENTGTKTAASFDLAGNVSATEVTLAQDNVIVGDGTGVGAETPLNTIIKTDKVSITNAQLKALRATPKTLVAAPGSGKVLQFVSAILKNQGGTNALTESADNAAVKYTDGSGVAVSETIECTGFIDQTAKTQTQTNAIKDAIVASSGAENKALVLHNTGDGEWGGNAANDVTVDVYVTYRVITIA